jgi:hypothetical protein
MEHWTFFFFLYIPKRKTNCYETLQTWEWDIELCNFFYAYQKQITKPRKLYKFENGSMTLFLFLYIQKRKAYLYETLYTWEWNIELHFFFYTYKKENR